MYTHEICLSLNVWILFVRSHFKLLFMGALFCLRRIVKQYTTERDENDINHGSGLARSL